MKNVINESKINKSIDDLENLQVVIVWLSFCKKYLKENNMKEIKV